jgi:serine/threonine protein kinase
VGTEGFIPPEGPGKPQADLYSLGKVLYEISTGKDRHDFPDLSADLRDSADQSGFAELNEIILRACASEVAQRYRSAEEMQGDLALLQQGKSVKQKRLNERRWALTNESGLQRSCAGDARGRAATVDSVNGRLTRPMDPKALELYTDGQAYLEKGPLQDVDEAIPLLEQALALTKITENPRGTRLGLRNEILLSTRRPTGNWTLRLGTPWTGHASLVPSYRRPISHRVTCSGFAR